MPSLPGSCYVVDTVGKPRRDSPNLICASKVCSINSVDAKKTSSAETTTIWRLQKNENIYCAIKETWQASKTVLSFFHGSRKVSIWARFGKETLMQRPTVDYPATRGALYIRGHLTALRATAEIVCSDSLKKFVARVST